MKRIQAIRFDSGCGSLSEAQMDRHSDFPRNLELATGPVPSLRRGVYQGTRIVPVLYAAYDPSHDLQAPARN